MAPDAIPDAIPDATPEVDGGRARACLDRLIPEALERAVADYRCMARLGGPMPEDPAGWGKRQGALKAGIAHLEALCRLAGAARRLSAEGAAAGEGGGPDLAGLIAGARAELAATAEGEPPAQASAGADASGGVSVEAGSEPGSDGDAEGDGEAAGEDGS
ncbi:MAG: hypothetical protein RID91_10145 [Azospirillaceae bacterium]